MKTRALFRPHLAPPSATAEARLREEMADMLTLTEERLDHASEHDALSYTEYARETRQSANAVVSDCLGPVR